MIYAVSSRPVISILRNGSGRGAIPLRQSVITNSKREIVKYNHSKWMTITGNYGGARTSYITMSGSANFSLFAFTGDEQVQTIIEPRPGAAPQQASTPPGRRGARTRPASASRAPRAA